MAIGKETSNPLFSMIHLSQELTHLDVMRIVWNLYVLMYISSCVAAKNGDVQFLVIIEILILMLLCCWCSSSILKFLLLAIYQEILNLTLSNSRLGEDCKDFCQVKLLLKDTADELLRKTRFCWRLDTVDISEILRMDIIHR